MFQQSLNELDLLSIEKDMLNQINCDNLINDFTSQKARKIKFKKESFYVKNLNEKKN